MRRLEERRTLYHGHENGEPLERLWLVGIVQDVEVTLDDDAAGEEGAKGYHDAPYADALHRDMVQRFHGGRRGET